MGESTEIEFLHSNLFFLQMCDCVSFSLSCVYGCIMRSILIGGEVLVAFEILEIYLNHQVGIFQQISVCKL